MRLELAERLQCPGDHRPTPLVVVAAEVIDRDLRRGTAGCMQCGLQARFRDGDLWFTSDQATSTYVPGAADPSVHHPSARRDAAHRDDAPSPEAIDRLQALLGLDESGGAVLLGGRYAAYAAGLQSRLDLMIVVADPADAVFTSAPRVIAPAEVVPFTSGTFRAAALDVDVLLAAAVPAVRAGGRIVAPASCPVPASVTRLAQDASEWVGARGALTPVVPLQRAGPSHPAASN